MVVKVVDGDADFGGRRHQPELIMALIRHEGRYIKQLVGVLQHSGGGFVTTAVRRYRGIDRNKVVVTLMEGIGHLVDNRKKLIVPVVAIKQGQGVEGKAEKAGEAEQRYPCGYGLAVCHAGLGDMFAEGYRLLPG